MTKMLVYSHDTFGLGNIRRMLAICSHLAEASPDLSTLLVTGSPLIQSEPLGKTKALHQVAMPDPYRPRHLLHQVPRDRSSGSDSPSLGTYSRRGRMF